MAASSNLGGVVVGMETAEASPAHAFLLHKPKNGIETRQLDDAGATSDAGAVPVAGPGEAFARGSESVGGTARVDWRVGVAAAATGVPVVFGRSGFEIVDRVLTRHQDHSQFLGQRSQPDRKSVV